MQILVVDALAPAPAAGHPARLAAAALVLATVIASAATVATDAKANELPQDTNHVESLTPEQARILAAQFHEELIETEYGTHGTSGCLTLNGLESLDAETAKALAECTVQQLSLNGLTTLSDDAAKALAECKSLGLSLNGLTTLSTDAAKALAECRGHYVFLNGLTTLSDDAAKALAECKGQGLSLNGLARLSADAVKALAESKVHYLDLNGLTTLSADAAQALADFKGLDLSLGNLMSRLGQAESLTLGTARLVLVRACARPPSEVSLYGLTALDTPDAVEIAKILATTDGRLSLPNLKKISADAANALAEFKGDKLALDGLTTLDAETARLVGACTNSGSEVSLSGLMALDTPDAVEIAKILATANELLSIPNLKKISADAAKALAERKGEDEDLILDGLTTLSADTAKALADFKGRQLSLNGLTRLSADAAEALADFKGQQLSLNGLTTLSAETARLVCVCAQPGSGASLYGLTALDTPDAVEIAKILATAKGRLALPNLKKISPKTLTALIEKTDVVIPPLATLELIPEPDGSLTEDFVIPEGFEKR